MQRSTLCRPAASAALGLGWGMVLFAVLGGAAADLSSDSPSLELPPWRTAPTGFSQPWLVAVCSRMRHRRFAWLADALFSSSAEQGLECSGDDFSRCVLCEGYAGLWCCVLVWRGVWQLWDCALGPLGLAGDFLAGLSLSP